ncbi:MAG: hypothetical protein WD989_00575 [Candidatus Paceibacterota bacterium]
MKNFKFLNFNFQILFLVALLVFPIFVFADEEGPNDFVYLFHLYHDNGQLFADRDFEFTYDVIPESFVPETVNAQFPYKGEIITLNNLVVHTFVFDPRRGDPSFLKGKISVKAPYAPDGQKAVFYDAQGVQVLTIFVSESSFCNDDGVCNVDNGEDQKTCPSDCKGVTPLPPIPEEPAGGQGGMLMSIIYVLIIAGAAAGGWFGWKWWKGRQQPPMMPFPPANLPPQPPITQ